jgi:1-acyl-sn-glycerol-3-phosphate acyltransferase
MNNFMGSKTLPRINAIWRVPLIILVTGILSSISVLFSLVDGSGRLQHRCAHLWASFIFWVSRVTITVEGIENIDPRRGYVFVANHLSMFDHWAFLYSLPLQFRFVAKSSLFKIPFLGWHLRRSGNIPVHFDNARKTIRNYRRVTEKVASGLSLVIYPEGERTFDGVTVKFKRGAFLLPKEARTPIVPVTLSGAHKRLKRGSMVIYPGEMRMIIHEPIEYETFADWKLQELAVRVRQIVLERYEL